MAQTKGTHMKTQVLKKLVATVLLGAGFASHIETSDNNYPNCPPCNVGTPSPKNSPQSSPAPTPRGSDSDDKK
jgi:hypothetical protein